MTYLIKPDLVSEVAVRRFEEHVEIVIEGSCGNNWVLALPDGEILEYVAARIIHHHLDTQFSPPF